ncbi:MAG: NAD-binding protein [Chthoniobacterales bacterium]|nr:NAD-binding protein [Chthoniobacterales bacterium]
MKPVQVEKEGLPRPILMRGQFWLIALELRQMFRRFRVEVTVLHRSGRLLAHGDEAEGGEEIEKVFTNEGINVLSNVSVRSVWQDRKEAVVTIESEGKTREIKRTGKCYSPPTGFFRVNRLLTVFKSFVGNWQTKFSHTYAVACSRIGATLFMNSTRWAKNFWPMPPSATMSTWIGRK